VNGFITRGGKSEGFAGRGSTVGREEDAVVRGSCLCGAVRFGYARAVTQVGMCHCSQCRKVSGTGSNAVIVVPESDFEWISGKEHQRTFAKPSGWQTTFCVTCGSPLPQSVGGAAAYWVPAGLLDDDPGLRVGGHIFVGSKAPWDEIRDDTPRFVEGPNSAKAE
jgi:hypothetical protein